MRKRGVYAASTPSDVSGFYNESMSLIVTGTIGIDTVETPAGEHREGILGGSCTYFAAAASFFTPVRLVAAVGEDFPDEFEQLIKRFEGVDARGLERRAGSKTFRWGGKYRENMDERDTTFTDLGVLAEAPPTVPAEFKDSKVVFLANSHPSVQAGMLEQLPNRQMAVADTMDIWIDNAKPELGELLGKVDGLVLNFDEAELFTGKRNPVTAGKLMLESGPRFVVIKKGEHGCILIHRDGIAALPAFPAEKVVDPTGAGDSFAAGMMGSIAAGLAADPTIDPGSFEVLRRACVHGTVIASFTIEDFSLERLSTLTSAELNDRDRAFRSMLHVG